MGTRDMRRKNVSIPGKGNGKLFEFYAKFRKKEVKSYNNFSGALPHPIAYSI